MAIKLSKNSLCMHQIVGQMSERIVAEGDEIVPDVKPDIFNIISTNGNICIHKREVQDGRVKIEGSVNIYVTYIADDEKSSIRALNTNIDFARTIEMSKLKTGMQLDCTKELQSIDCKILNGRKINLKANILLSLTAYSNEDVEYVGDVENTGDLQLLNQNIMVNLQVGSGTTKVYAKDTISIDNVDNLSEIMKVTLSLENKENKISYNKVLTKADAIFKLVYLTDDGRINTVCGTIPVMGFIDIQGVEESDICKASYELKNIIIKPNNVEEHSVYVEAEIEIFCSVFRRQEINIIQDIYSRTSELQYTQKNIKVIQESEQLLETFNLRKQTRIEEIGQNKIYDVEVTPKIVTTQVEEGRALYQGELNLIFIYSEEGSSRVNVKNVIEPFDFAVTSPKIDTKVKLNTEISIAKQDFVVMSDSNIDMKIDLSFKLDITKEEEINIIDEISKTEALGRETYSIVIYYAKPGDTLWKIAKRFGSTVEDIVRVNNIENPDVIMPGEQLFIPR